MKFRELCFALGLLWAPHAAWAQTANVPANVNDCTLIQDPVELRNCILRFEGNRIPPPNVVESYGAKPSATQTEPTDLGIARDQPSRRERSRVQRPVETSQAATAPRPRANDTLISIEQVQIPPKLPR